MNSGAPPKFTPRQSQIMSTLIDHGTAKATAKALGVAPSTVKTHLEDAKRRAGVATSLQLVVAFDRANRSSI